LGWSTKLAGFGSTIKDFPIDAEDLQSGYVCVFAMVWTTKKKKKFTH